MHRPSPASRNRLAAASSSLLAALGVAAAVIVGLLATPARASTLVTWTGGAGSGDWATAGNWDPSGAAPTTSGTYSLVFSGSTQVSTTNTLGAIAVNSILFANGGLISATTAPVGVFTLAGSTLNLANTTISTAAATNTAPYDGDLLSVPLSIVGSNTVTLGASHPLTFGGNISGTGSLTFNGGGSAITISYLSGSNSYSGGTRITGGFVQTGARVDPITQLANTSNNFALGSGAVIVSDTGTLLVRNNSIVTNVLTISGSGAGSGALTGSFGVTGQTAEYRGNITLAGDTRFSTASSAAGDTTSKLLISGNVDLGSSLLTLRSQRQNAVSATGGLLIEITGTMVGTGGIDVSGSAVGRVLISSSNSYSGGSTVTSGTLSVGNSRALGTGFLAVNTNGLDLNGQSLLVGALSGSSAGVIQSNIGGSSTLRSTSSTTTTYNGTIRNGPGGGSVNFGLAGTGTLTFTGSNTYTGTTAIDGGVLVMGSLGALAGGGDIGFGGGTLRYTGSNTLDYSSRFRNSGSAISIDTNSQQVTFASSIDSSNVAGLTKLGLGILYLNAANAFTGPTTVASGTLAGTGSVLGGFTVQSGAVFDPGATSTATTIFGVGSFAQAGGGTTRMQVNGTTAGSLYDQVLFSGTSKTVSWGGQLDLTLSGSYANYTQFDLFSGFTTYSGDLAGITFAAGSPYGGLSFSGPTAGVWSTGWSQSGQYFTFNQNTGVLMVVPEPSTMAIASIGITALGLTALRRRRRAT